MVSAVNLVKEVHKCLRTVISQYYYKPHLFFNEVGFHNYCFAVFYRNPAFTKTFKTKDGKSTNILHPEYGSVNRDTSGRRFWYDMVVLNPRFIEENEYNRVTANKISLIKDYKKNDLISLFEFKFTKNEYVEYQKQLQKDYHSLKNAVEAKNKYMVVFANFEKSYDYQFKGMKWEKGIKFVYVQVYFDEKNKKHIKVTIKPSNFLNLPKGWLKK